MCVLSEEIIACIERKLKRRKERHMHTMTSTTGKREEELLVFKFHNALVFREEYCTHRGEYEGKDEIFCCVFLF